MRPRRCRRGKLLRHRTVLAGSYRFNEATAVSPWKTPRVRDRLEPVRGFNEATAVSPWKTCRRSPKVPAVDRFNEATAMSPWKTGPLRNPLHDND